MAQSTSTSLPIHWPAHTQDPREEIVDVLGRREIRARCRHLRPAQPEFAGGALADPDRFRVVFIENDQGAMDELGQRPEMFAGSELLMKRVAAGIAAGELRKMPADRATFVLWGAVHGVGSLSMAVKELDFGDVRDVARLAADTALRGLAPEQASARGRRK